MAFANKRAPRRMSSIAAIGLAIVVSCSPRDEPSPLEPQAQTAFPAQVIAWNPIGTLYADPGDTVAQAPTVRVLDMTGTIPIPGSLVRFSITAGGGSILRDSVLADANGLASVGRWRLGSVADADTLIAIVDGLPPVIFSADARAPVAIYDLRSVGGHPVPYTYPWDWTISGGQYVLYNDGTCMWGYEGSPVGPPSELLYVRVDSVTIQFYGLPGTYNASPFYLQRHGLFSTGKLSGNGTMTVTYEDAGDFDNPEVYALRAAPTANR